MNIFATSIDPVECAKHLCDKRVVKMILETSQMLSTALKISCPELYRKEFSGELTKANKKIMHHYFNGTKVSGPTHENHPANKWIRKTRSNYLWAVDHLEALCIEKINRFKTPHKLHPLVPKYREFAKFIPEGEMTPHANCAANDSKGISFKHIQDVYTAYKLYLDMRWKSDARPPKWYREER